MTFLDRMLRAREIVDRDGASIRQALIEAFLKTDPTDVDGYIRANHLMQCVLAEKGILDLMIKRCMKDDATIAAIDESAGAIEEPEAM